MRVIGIIELASLVGAPFADHAAPPAILQKTGIRAVEEMQELTKAGCDGVLVRNSGDFPFYSQKSSADALICLSILAAALREDTPGHLGLQLFGAGLSATVSCAAITGSDFVSFPLSGWNDEVAEAFRDRTRLHTDVKLVADLTQHSPEDQAGVLGGLPSAARTLWESCLSGLIVRPVAGSVRLDVPIYFLIEDQKDLEFLCKQQGTLPSGIFLGSLIRKKNRFTEEIDSKRIRDVFSTLKSAGLLGKKSKGVRS